MDFAALGGNLLGEVTVKVKGTTDGLEHGEADSVELGVVGDLKTTADGHEHWHVELGQIGVGNERQSTTNHGKVWCADGRNLVAVESEGTVQFGERWDGDGGDVADGHVVCPDEVWESGADVPAVGLEGEGLGDVAKLHVNLVKIVVVGDEHLVDLLQVDTVQAVKLSVLDGDGRSELNTLSAERKGLQSVEDVPVNGSNIGEDWEVEVGEDGQALQAEGVGNGLESRARKGGHAGDVVGDQATLDLLDTVESDVVGGASGNGNATGEGSAAGESRCITGVLDGSGGSAARSGFERSVVVLLALCFWRCDLTCCTAKSSESWNEVLDSGHVDCEMRC